MTDALHYECSLEQADGNFDLELKVNTGDAGDLFGGPSAPAFGAATTPNSHWWDGKESGLEFVTISAAGPSIVINTQPVWQNSRVVRRTHAKNIAFQSWALLDGDNAWFQLSATSLDGHRDIFLTLCDALANGRKVDILLYGGRIVEVTLK
jgi:hypothetical protein